MYWNKKSVQNSAILLAAITFLALNFAPIVESSQQTKTGEKSTATKSKATPTPNKNVKKSPTPKPTVKPIPKTAPKSTPKPTLTPTPVKTTTQTVSQVIATVAAARVRANASTGSAELRRIKLGTLIKVLEKNKNGWYKIEIPAKPKNVVGWISSQVANDWDSAKRDDIYERIVRKNYKTEETSFVNASELFDFLTKVQTEAKTDALAADYGLKRLLMLRQALKAIPFNKSESSPYKEFLRANTKNVVYSEPAGEWYVQSDLFWDSQKKYANLSIAEEIAWQGAQNPLPGECEGYLNCYLFLLRETYSKYLELYPGGKYSTQALTDIQNMLEPIMADLSEKSVYDGPTDVSDRAEFNRLISEIRAIVSRMMIAELEKQKTIQQLNQIAEAYR